jgi:hypothetical protein
VIFAVNNQGRVEEARPSDEERREMKNKIKVEVKCPECGSRLEQDPVHILCLRCVNPDCNYWCGLHPPSIKETSVMEQNIEAKGASIVEEIRKLLEGKE